MVKVLIIKLLCIAIFLNICTSIYGKYTHTYVYCINNEKNWNWLKDVNKNNYQVFGNWNISKYPLNGVTIEFSYFIPFHSSQTINELSELCKKQYGDEYHIPQPANHALSNWSLFGYDSNNFANGVVDIYLYSNSMLYSELNGYNLQYLNYILSKEMLRISSEKIKFNLNLLSAFRL